MKRFSSWALIAVFVNSGALVGLGRTAWAVEPAPGHPLRGVNLAGLDFGEGNIPGVYGKDYTSPTRSELDYFNSAGLKVIRLPFRWERVQQTLNGPLDITNLGYLDAIVTEAGNRGLKVLLDPYNYGRYKINGVDYVIGSPQVPRDAFYDFWRKVATHFASSSAIYAYGLVNEPHDMGAYDWKTTAQGAVNAIREVDMVHSIAVPGDG